MFGVNRVALGIAGVKFGGLALGADAGSSQQGDERMGDAHVLIILLSRAG